MGYEWVAAIAAVILGIVGYWIGSQKDAKKYGERWGRLDSNIETIKRDVAEIKTDHRDAIRRLHDRLDMHLREDHGLTVPRRE